MSGSKAPVFVRVCTEARAPTHSADTATERMTWDLLNEPDRRPCSRTTNMSTADDSLMVLAGEVIGLTDRKQLAKAATKSSTKPFTRGDEAAHRPARHR